MRLTPRGEGLPPDGEPRPFLREMNWAFAVAGAIYLMLFVYFAARASILAPYSDMIDLVGDYFHAADLGGPVEYLLQPHNFHRLVGLRTLIALDVGVFRGTGLPLVAAAATFQAGVAMLLMSEARRVAGALAVPLSALAAMLAYLTANAGDVSQPVNTAYIHATFFSLLALAAAASASTQSGGWRGWASAIAWASAASFSLAVALVVWPILALFAWRGKASWRTITLVAIAGGAFYLAFMSGQSASSQLPVLDLGKLIKIAEYFLAYLGLPWVRGTKLMGEALGAGLLAASLFALVRFGLADTNRTQRLAIGMILFSLSGAALAAVGRSSMLPEVDVPVRYTILVTPLHAGLLLLAAPTIVRIWERRPRLASLGLIAALALLLVQQVVVGMVIVRAAERARQTIAQFHLGERTPEMLQLVHPDLMHVDMRYADMRRRGVFLQWICEPGGSPPPEGVKDRGPLADRRC